MQCGGRVVSIGCQLIKCHQKLGVLVFIRGMKVNRMFISLKTLRLLDLLEEALLVKYIWF